MSKGQKLVGDPLRDIPYYLGVFRAFVGARMYLVVALAILASIAEGIGIVMLLPLLQTLDGLGSEALTGVGAVLADFLDWVGIGDSVFWILVIITVFFLLKGVFLFLSQGYSAYLRGQLLRELKVRIYDAYRGMRLEYYNSRDTGHFINVIDAQIVKTLWAFKDLMYLAGLSLTVIVYFIAAFLVAWGFGLMAVILGFLLFLVFRVLSIYVRETSRKCADEAGLLSHLLIQTLQSFKYLVSTGQSEKPRGRTVASIMRLGGYEIRMGIAQAFTSSVREPLAVVAILIIVAVQIIWFQQPIGPIVVSILLFYRALGGVLEMQRNWQQVLSHIGSVELVDNELAVLSDQRESAGSRDIGPLMNAIEFRDVHFSYNAAEGDVLAGVSMVIPARSSVALVGPSGSGKSTVIDLITLMLRPRSGRILIDGIPGEEIRPTSWRNQIGFVSQETVIFDDTIANNICLWQGEIAKEPFLLERIRKAAGEAHIAGLIESLPDGYNTVVGDRGVRLSGGQRQRLFVARELFKRPRLLILDEATSALDSESELAIQQSIDALRGKITVVMIAHRLATIRNVDKVFVLEEGRIVEEGSYDVLRNDRQSRLARMVAMQEL